jgi:hypothetical protein
VILAGPLWGDWTALQERVRSGLACLATLDELDEDEEDALDEANVETAAAEFRYARDLVAAADLEAWLEGRGLSVEAWRLHPPLASDRALGGRPRGVAGDPHRPTARVTLIIAVLIGDGNALKLKRELWGGGATRGCLQRGDTWCVAQPQPTSGEP